MSENRLIPRQENSNLAREEKSSQLALIYKSSIPKKPKRNQNRPNFSSLGGLQKAGSEQRRKRKATQHSKATSTQKSVKSHPFFDGICDVLSYYLNQNSPKSGVNYVSSNAMCLEWELQEIKHATVDTNLGDFIIKLPNPDNLPQQWIDRFPELQDEAETVMVSLLQAMDCFNDFYEEQEGSLIADLQKEQLAFSLAFYCLGFHFGHKVSREVARLIEVYKYYKQLEPISLQEFISLRESSDGFYRLEASLESNLSDEGGPSRGEQKHQVAYEALTKDLNKLLDQLRSNGKESQNLFDRFKKDIHGTLSNILKQQLIFDINHTPTSSFIEQLIGSLDSITLFLRTFPQVLTDILNYLFDDHSRHVSERRKLFRGNYLRRKMVDQQLMWTNTRSRPADVTTLLRNSLMYRLVVKQGVFARAFLSRDQTSIMIVVKAADKSLEEYAQAQQIKLEVDLGTSDLFSFEPVDHYMRPLRLNPFIRDRQFIEKYDVENDPKLRQEDFKNVESEAVNIFRKAQGMNEEELRARIISDQMEADKEYLWVSRKLNLDLPKESIRENESNKHKTSRQTWEVYYVYNKMLICFIRRARQLYKMHENSSAYTRELDNNVGMILRLMFLKAIATCNLIYTNYRLPKHHVPLFIANFFEGSCKLKNIWTYMQIKNPTGFWPYVRTNKSERIWRKFQINQLQDRSKFFPSQRLIIISRMIKGTVNISKCLSKNHIMDFFALHDPFILKNILIAPYLKNVTDYIKGKMEIRSVGLQRGGSQIRIPKAGKTKLGKSKADGEGQRENLNEINQVYQLYECQATKLDYTKLSLAKKLAFQWRAPSQFSIQSVRYYCGEKIALYFAFMQFLIVKAKPFLLVASLTQLFLWVENSHIAENGVSYLTRFNNGLIFVLTCLNIFWTTQAIEGWENEEKKLAYQFGVDQINKKNEKRSEFVGNFQYDFRTDELNDEVASRPVVLFKNIFTGVLSIAYVALVLTLILLIFSLQSILFELAYPQSLVSTGISILITVTVKISNYIYLLLVKHMTVFQNHKTSTAYESSLVFKSYLVCFVTTFITLFVYAFAASSFSATLICAIRTTATNQSVTNCSYFVSAQLLSIIIVDLIMNIISAIAPFLIFKVKEYLSGKEETHNNKQCFSCFHAIDQFFEEQDNMESYMYNNEIDCTWQGYMKVVTMFTAVALFGPALPLAYVMIFVTGIIRLHTSKYEIIFLKKRNLPAKANSINFWLKIIKAVGYFSVLTNVAYMVYTREAFVGDDTTIFFFFVVAFLLFKLYLISTPTKKQQEMSERNTIHTTRLLFNRERDLRVLGMQSVNTDIENVVYDEGELHRRVRTFGKAKINRRKIKKKKLNSQQ